MVQMSESCLPLSTLAPFSLCTRLFSVIGQSVKHPLFFFSSLFLLFQKFVLKQVMFSRWEIWTVRAVLHAGRHIRANSQGNAVDDPFVYRVSQDHALARVPWTTGVLVVYPFYTLRHECERASGHVPDGAKRLSDAAAGHLCCNPGSLWWLTLFCLPGSASQKCHRQDVSLTWKWGWAGGLFFCFWVPLFKPPCFALVYFAWEDWYHF